MLEAQEFFAMTFAAFTIVLEAKDNLSLLLKRNASVFTLLEDQEVLH